MVLNKVGFYIAIFKCLMISKFLEKIDISWYACNLPTNKSANDYIDINRL